MTKSLTFKDLSEIIGLFIHCCTNWLKVNLGENIAYYKNPFHRNYIKIYIWNDHLLLNHCGQVKSWSFSFFENPLAIHCSCSL